jgi:dTDP-glucose 4,6-dehydratase
MILKAMVGEPLPVYGDGGNVRDWLYVTDHCAALARVLAAGRVGETYNIGGNAELRNLDVVLEICRMVDERAPRGDGSSREAQIAFVEDRPGHDRRYAIDSGKIRRELGWAPTVRFRQGLAQTIDWYLANADWIRRVQDRGYGGERLGRGQ